MQTIGIPRGLLYFRYGEFWQKYLTELGFQVKVSRPTSKATVEQGLGRVSSEVCLPVKIIAGHIEELKSEVDWLFLPRMVWLRDELYACPKMIGISDLARVNVRGACRVLAPTIKGNFRTAHLKAGLQLTGNPVKTWQAWQASHDLLARRRILPEFPADTGKVALISHFYNLGDRYVAQDIAEAFSGAGLRVYTKEDLPDSVLARSQGLARQVRWLYERELYSAFRFYADKVDGICAVVSFGCGPDSLITELMSQEARQLGLPFTQLVIDEHTGKAGVVTRLEAFVDMLARKSSHRRTQTDTDDQESEGDCPQAR
jgi:predicted nucleotide-binding protein (sugar kinase/HSP70/actin superfamily)